MEQMVKEAGKIRIHDPLKKQTDSKVD